MHVVIGMRRGRDISHLNLSVNVLSKVRLKKYTWICEECGREYIAREDASTCESYHFAIASGVSKRDLEDLWDFLTEKWMITKKLLTSSLHE